MQKTEEALWRYIGTKCAGEWAGREIDGVLLHEYEAERTCRRCGNRSTTAWAVVFRDWVHYGVIICEHCFAHADFLRKPKNIGKRRSLSAGLRWRVLQEAGHRCFYCGRHVSQLDPALYEFLHVDHIVPVADGGTDDISNLVCSCSTCNLGKGQREANIDADAVASPTSGR